MQALKFEKTGSLDELSLVNIDKPVVRPGEALVRVRAAGVNGVRLQLEPYHTHSNPLSVRCCRRLGHASICDHPTHSWQRFLRGSR
jgi:hypothetical protein